MDLDEYSRRIYRDRGTVRDTEKRMGEKEEKKMRLRRK